MSSPWDPAITQAMQRHGGSNRSIPKTVQPRSSMQKTPPDPNVVKTPMPEDGETPAKPESAAG